MRTLAVTGFPTYTKYGLEKTTGLKPAAVRNHLKTLIEAGLVKEIPLRPRVYMVDDKNSLAILLIEFFRKSGYAK
jgi:DNA-binding transcriptional ArsR family regulator